MGLADTIVVDWGTTNFRAWRLGADGAVTETYAAPAGILAVPGGVFEDALECEIGHWLAPDLTVLFAGMVTSRNGWQETPYVAAPASLEDLARGARRMTARTGAHLLFLPGVAMRGHSPDVMRGEEIQVFGAVGPEETATVILPGTHSKWVRVEKGRIVSFRTFFTGEMFALLTQHSMLGKVPAEGEPADGAFLAGVEAAKAARSGFLNTIFAVRAGALLGNFPAQDARERLSGVVIGHEIAGALAGDAPLDTLRLVGDPTLCARYRAALAAFGLTAEIGPEQATIEGFRKLVQLS